MFLKYFYDDKLSHASYLVGCQTTGEAVVVDPARYVDQYIKVIKSEGMNLVGSLETHIHADFVSGTRELANRLGTKMYLSDEGGADWKYQNLDNLPYQLIKDNDQIKIGNLIFDVMHTPGHTPESLSFILTDGETKTNHPIGVFTGDFIFVGDVGRPDLLEKVSGIQGTSLTGAMEMYESISRFKSLADYLQVWPSHGAGSACGKSLGAVPSTTVGYEKRSNWALQHENFNSFLENLLEGQPDPPHYFNAMKRINKIGPEVVNELPSPNFISNIEELKIMMKKDVQIIDTRSYDEFSKSHIPGTINIPFNKSFTKWAGWTMDNNLPIYLLTNPKHLEELMISLQAIGMDKIEYYSNVNEIIQLFSKLESYQNLTREEAGFLIDNGDVFILDVRNNSEWAEGYIEGARHIKLGMLSSCINELPISTPILVYCKSGTRSAIASSILQAGGLKNIFNLSGGYLKWSAPSYASKIV
ncbi:MBL fold metallo-hydrolase [Paenisporosarcina sp.]|uniref:MBL fold metallo-hydrolase n=1 Tax=Paenisporosarcina sp. TaxID=1932001 RepID=UPI003C725F5C